MLQYRIVASHHHLAFRAVGIITTMASDTEGVRDVYVTEFAEFEGLIQALLPCLKE